MGYACIDYAPHIPIFSEESLANHCPSRRSLVTAHVAVLAASPYQINELPTCD